MESEPRITFGELVSGSFELMRSYWRATVAFVLVTGLVEAVFTVSGYSDVGLWTGLVVGFFAGYFLLEVILEAEGLRSGRGRGSALGVYLGVSILVSLLMVLGFLFLVLPGLILMSRWIVASPLAVSGETSVTEAMRRSWDMTRRSQWSLVGLSALFIFGIFMIGGGAGGFEVWQESSGGSPGIVSTAVELIVIVLTQALTAFGIVAGVVAMRSLAGTGKQLGDVFS